MGGQGCERGAVSAAAFAGGPEISDLFTAHCFSSASSEQPWLGQRAGESSFQTGQGAVLSHKEHEGGP